MTFAVDSPFSVSITPSLSNLTYYPHAGGGWVASANWQSQIGNEPHHSIMEKNLAATTARLAKSRL